MISGLLEAYQRGETHVQHQLLDEMEPLLYGMYRSLTPAGDDSRERALRAAHALTLSFHLRACAGRVHFDKIKEMRAYAHSMALTRLHDDEPLELCPLADAETGSIVYKCFGIQLMLESELSDQQVRLLAERLAGKPLPPGERVQLLWADARARLVELGVLAD